MPNVKALLAVTTPVTVERGSLAVTLDAKLEGVSIRDAAYRKLIEAAFDIETRRQALLADVEAAFTGIAALNVPDEPTVLSFRSALENDLVAVQSALEADDRAATATALVAATARLQSFSLPLIPAAEEQQARQQARQQAAEQKLAEASAAVDVLAAEGHRNAAQRVAYLCPSWDVTEEIEGQEKPWPITEENLLSLSADFVENIVGEVEKKVVRGFAPQPEIISNS